MWEQCGMKWRGRTHRRAPLCWRGATAELKNVAIGHWSGFGTVFFFCSWHGGTTYNFSGTATGKQNTSRSSSVSQETCHFCRRPPRETPNARTRPRAKRSPVYTALAREPLQTPSQQRSFHAGRWRRWRWRRRRWRRRWWWRRWWRWRWRRRRSRLWRGQGPRWPAAGATPGKAWL